MTLTAEQSRALVDAIAAAPSSVALGALRLEARRRWGSDLRGSFRTARRHYAGSIMEQPEQAGAERARYLLERMGDGGAA